jgi:hypothetical protein
MFYPGIDIKYFQLNKHFILTEQLREGTAIW